MVYELGLRDRLVRFDKIALVVPPFLARCVAAVNRRSALYQDDNHCR
jgi:hypothetical protein